MSRLTAGGVSPDTLSKDVSTRVLDSVRVGELAGKVSQGVGNVYVGYQTGQNTVGGYYDTFIGYQAGNANIGSSYSTFIGAQCGGQSIYGDEAVGIGYKAMEMSSGASQATAVGAYALRQNVGGIASVAVGYRAGENILNGQYNTILGAQAAQNMRTGDNNTIQGYQAGRAAFSINENAYFGAFAGYSNSVGDGNCLFGYKAGYALVDGNCNVAIGAFALYSGSNVNSTIAIGPYAGGGSGGGAGGAGSGLGATEAVILGTFAACNGAPQQSVVIGTAAAVNASGAGSVLIGFHTASNLQGGSCNIIIGIGADVLHPDTYGAISIGSENAVVASESISIGGAIFNSRQKSVLVGFGLSNDGDNSVLLGLSNSVVLVDFFRDPLSLDYQSQSSNDALKLLNITDINYANLLSNVSNVVYPVAQAIYQCDTLSNNETQQLNSPVIANYDLTTQTPVFSLVQGLCYKIITDVQYQNLLSSNQNIFTQISSNVQDLVLSSGSNGGPLLFTPTTLYPTSDIFDTDVLDFTMSFTNNSQLPTVNIDANYQASNYTVQVSLPKRIAPPVFSSSPVEGPYVTLPVSQIPFGNIIPPSVSYDSSNGVLCDSITPILSSNIDYAVFAAPMFGSLNLVYLDSHTWPHLTYTMPVEHLFATHDSITIATRLHIPSCNVFIPSLSNSTLTFSLQMSNVHLLTNAIYMENKSYPLGSNDIITTDNYTIPTYISDHMVLTSNGDVYTASDLQAMSNETLWDYTPDKLPYYYADINNQITADINSNIYYTITNVYPALNAIATYYNEAQQLSNIISPLHPSTTYSDLTSAFAQLSNTVVLGAQSSNQNMLLLHNLDTVYNNYFAYNNFAASWSNLLVFSNVAATHATAQGLQKLISLAPPSYSNLVTTLNYKYNDPSIKRLFISQYDLNTNTVALSNIGSNSDSESASVSFHILGNAPVYCSYRTRDLAWTDAGASEPQSITIPFSNINVASTYTFTYPPDTNYNNVFVEKYPSGGIPIMSLSNALNYRLYNPRLTRDSFNVVLTNTSGRQVLTQRSVSMDTSTRVVSNMDMLVFPTGYSNYSVAPPSLLTEPVSTSNQLFNIEYFTRTTTCNETRTTSGQLTTNCNVTISNISLPIPGISNYTYNSFLYQDLTSSGAQAATPIVTQSFTAGSGQQAYTNSNITIVQLLSYGGNQQHDTMTSNIYVSNTLYVFNVSAGYQTIVSSNISELVRVYPIAGDSNIYSSTITTISGNVTSETTSYDVGFAGAGAQAYETDTSFTLTTSMNSAVIFNSNIDIYIGSNTSNYCDILTSNLIYSTSETYNIIQTQPVLSDIQGSIQVITTSNLLVTSNIDIYQSYTPLTSYHVSKGWSCNETYAAQASQGIHTVIKDKGLGNIISLDDIRSGNVFILGSNELQSQFTISLRTLDQDQSATYVFTGWCIPGLCNSIVDHTHLVPVSIDQTTQLGNMSNALLDVCGNTPAAYLHVYSVGPDCCIVDSASNMTTLVNLSDGYPLFFANNRYTSNEVTYFVTGPGYVSPLYRGTFYIDQSPFPGSVDLNLSQLDPHTTIGPPAFYYSRSGISPPIVPSGTEVQQVQPATNPPTFTLTSNLPNSMFTYMVGGQSGIYQYHVRSYIYDNFPIPLNTKGTIQNVLIGGADANFSNVLLGNLWNQANADTTFMVDQPATVQGFFWSSNYPNSIIQNISYSDLTSSALHFIPRNLNTSSNATVGLRVLQQNHVSPVYNITVKNYISVVPLASNLAGIYAVPVLSPDLINDGYQWTSNLSSDGNQIYQLGYYSTEVPVIPYVSAQRVSILKYDSNITVDQADCGSIGAAISGCVDIAACDPSNVTFYISSTPKHGILTKYRFSYADADEIQYKHIGYGIADDRFTVAVSSNPFDVSFDDISITVNIRPIPLVSSNAIEYVYFDDLNTASNLHSNITNLTITGLGYIHITNTFNLVTTSALFSNISDIMYTPYSNVFINNDPPYEPLSFSFATSPGLTLNPLITTNSPYSSMFINTHTIIVNEHILSNVYNGGTESSVQGITYTVDPKSSIRQDRTVQFNVSVQPTWDLSNPQLTKYRTQKLSIRLISDDGSDIVRITIYQDGISSQTSLSLADGTIVTKMFPYQVLQTGSYNSIQLINTPGNSFTISVTNLGTTVGYQLFTNLPPLSFYNLHQFLIEVPITDPANLQFANIATLTETIDGHDINSTYLKYRLTAYNFRTVYLFQTVEIQISRYNQSTLNQYETESHNIVIGGNIKVRGDGNLCIGNNFSTSGTNNIILGNNIGTQLQNAEIYQSIVIGTSNFTGSYVNNIICIGNNNLEDIAIQSQSIINHFMSKNPIIIGNNITSRTIGFYVNIADTILKTDVPTTGPEQIYVGLGHEVVRIGYTTNIGLTGPNANASTLYDLDVAGIIHARELHVDILNATLTSTSGSNISTIDITSSNITSTNIYTSNAIYTSVLNTSNLVAQNISACNISAAFFAGPASNLAHSVYPGTSLAGSAFDGSTAVTWSVVSTSGNTSNSIVSRDKYGNFSAGVITATLLGTASNTSNMIYPGQGLSGAAFDGSKTVTWFVVSTSTNATNVIVTRDSLGNFAAGVISATLQGTATNVSNQIYPGADLAGAAFDGSAPVIWSVVSTSANAMNRIVSRDSSGNFAAGVITATLQGTASNTRTMIYPGQGLSGPAFDGSAAVTWSVVSTSANTVSIIVTRDPSGNFAAGVITATLQGTASNINNMIYAGKGLSGPAFDGSAAVTWSVVSTSANTVSRIVTRDPSGNFAAGVITATLQGTASNINNMIYAGKGLSGPAFDGSAAVTWSVVSTSVNNYGTIVNRDSSGNFSAGVITAVLQGTASNINNMIYAGKGLSGPAFDGSAVVTWSVVSTSANIYGTIVNRDSSGNFTAGVITATLQGTASNVSNMIYTGKGISGSAFDGSSAVTWSVVSTSANNYETIVNRDSYGNFSAGVITATLQGTASNVSNMIYAGKGLSGPAFDGSAAVTWSVVSTTASIANTIVCRDSYGNITGKIIGSATNTSNMIYAGQGLSGPAFDGSAAVTWSVISTSSNIYGSIVSRDSSGNFSAGVITATLLGTASNTSNMIYAGQGLSGLAFDGSAAVTWSVISTSSNACGSIVNRDQSGNFSAGVITATLFGTASNTGNMIYAGQGLSGAAFDGSAAVTWSVVSTSSNACGSIVSRDQSGNFSAGIITATLFGTASNTGNMIYAGQGLTGSAFDGSAAVTWSVVSTSSNACGSIVNRDLSGNFFAGVITATLQGTASNTGNMIYAGQGLSGAAFDGGAAVTWCVLSTSSNIYGSIVSRDLSGNFSAGVITATLLGTASNTSNMIYAGHGLSGPGFDGSAAVTWSVVSTSSNVNGSIVARDSSGSFSANNITMNGMLLQGIIKTSDLSGLVVGMPMVCSNVYASTNTPIVSRSAFAGDLNVIGIAASPGSALVQSSVSGYYNIPIQTYGIGQVQCITPPPAIGSFLITSTNAGYGQAVVGTTYNEASFAKVLIVNGTTPTCFIRI